MVFKTTPSRYKSNRRLRAWVLITIYLFIFFHIVHWKIKGVTLAPLELNELLFTLHRGLITAGAVFMLLITSSTLLFGRFFCGWGCHVLALQDASAWLLKILRVKPVPFRSRSLVWVPFIAAAYLFIWPQIDRIWKGEHWPGLKIIYNPQEWSSFMTTDLWRNLPGLWISVVTLFVCGFLIIYLLGSRSFCNYCCPYGAVFSAADKIAPGRIKLEGNCIQCGKCNQVCESHINVQKEVTERGSVHHSSCLRDLDCITVCPVQVLKFGSTTPPLLKRPFGIFENNFLNIIRQELPLILTFIITLIIYRGLYYTVPFFLSLAIAVITAGLVGVIIRIKKDRTISAGSVIVKKNGTLTNAGKLFLLVSVMLLVFHLHSGFIRWHEYYGMKEYMRFGKEVNRIEEAVIILSPSGRNALNHFKKCEQFGLYTPLPLLRHLASLYQLSGETGRALNYLEKIVLLDPGDLDARLRLAKTLFERNNMNRTEEILAPVIRHINSVSDKNLLAELLIQMGNYYAKSEIPVLAAKKYSAALPLRPHSANLHNNLAVVLMKTGNYPESIRHFEESIRLDPAHPEAPYHIGLILLIEKKYTEASSWFDKALHVNPAFSPAEDGLAKIQVILKDS